jgi:heptosyltransferase II
MSAVSERVAVVAPNWLGDAVMALPAIRDLRRHFTAARLIVAARPSVAALFRAVPGVDDIVSPDAVDGDIGILFPNSFHAAWRLKRAGMQERWGYRSDLRGMLLTRAIPRPRTKMHFGEYYQYLVRELGVATGPLTPRLVVPASKIDTASKLLIDHGWTPGQPLVGIAPGAAFGHAKRWAPERFAQLASSLRNELNVACVMLGRPEDREESLGAHAIDLVGKTDLLALMGVLSHCRVLVANDSGALHLAAALGVAVTAIYGPTDERYSLPLSSSETPEGRVRAISHDVFCRPCGLRDCPIDHRCMKRITTDRVFDVVREQLTLEVSR